ncbi:ribosome maturation factor RimP [Ruminococcus sp. YE71]|uniref:ribosome maturation factor RimP n=1 Tax=unclassified Ruminococcus TaxID=2608920 RepID=UPI00088B2F38|nr:MULTISPECIES: ribosome maturation factor RimP [unclassified Ruminococcus]SDA22901.1 ribosome maturation factor RimP [Ruminococcus sp. YE78]SFW38957.1 ribosome maturation factor RimP [Ruminococcus sp. YE71]
MNTVDKARQLAEPICERLGLYLWDVRFEKEGALWYLRIFIDRDEGIDMNICEEFSRAYNEVLDAEDFITQNYIFEAGSPGLGRKLTRREHFEVCTGDEVRVKLYKARDGQKDFTGLLADSTDEGFTLAFEVDDEGKPTSTAQFTYKECASVNLNDDQDLF